MSIKFRVGRKTSLWKSLSLLLPLPKQVSVPWNHQVSGSKQTGDNRLLHSLLTACCSYAILGHSMSWGPEVLRASETGFERSYMKDDLRFNSHKYTYHGLRCLSYTNPWKRSMKSCRMSFWAFHANLFLPDTHYWPVSSTVHCARGHFWSTIIFFMFLAVLL